MTYETASFLKPNTFRYIGKVLKINMDPGINQETILC